MCQINSLQRAMLDIIKIYGDANNVDDIDLTPKIAYSCLLEDYKAVFTKVIKDYPAGDDGISIYLLIRDNV